MCVCMSGHMCVHVFVHTLVYRCMFAQQIDVISIVVPHFLARTENGTEQLKQQ